MATYYFRNVGTAWNSNTSWSTTSSSGASAGVIPTALDAVIFDAGSANACPVSTTDGVCLTLTTTGWTGTITLNVNLRVSGSITLSATTTFAGTGYLGAIATGTITSNSVVIPYFMVGTGTAMTLTLSGNLNVTKFQLADVTTATTYTVNGNTMNVSGDIILNIGYSSSVVITGTTVFNLNGTSNIGSVTPNNFNWNNPITINTSGTITFGTGFIFGGSAFTYTAGTVDMLTNACLFRITGTCTFNSGSIVFSTWQPLNGITITLTSNVIAQTVYINHTATFTTTINGAFKVYVGDPNGSVGSLLHTMAGSGTLGGTATIEFTGKGGVGYWTNWYVLYGLATLTYRAATWNINMIINTAGTIFVLDKFSTTTGNYNYNLFGGSRTFTYTAGNVITKTLSSTPGGGLAFKGGTIQFATGHTIIGLNKIAWGRIILAGGGSFTMDEFPCGNATVVTQMTSTSTTNYTITLTSTANRNERIGNFIRVKNCTLANANSRQVLITHPKGNLGNNIGLRFSDVMNHGIPKALETNQPKFKSGKEIAYGAMGLVSDPNFASI